MVKPEVFTDAKQIADHLIAKKTVVLNLETASAENKRRIIDFLVGVAYANGGSLKPVANMTYIITPYNVGFIGEDLCWRAGKQRRYNLIFYMEDFEEKVFIARIADMAELCDRRGMVFTHFLNERQAFLAESELKSLELKIIAFTAELTMRSALCYAFSMNIIVQKEVIFRLPA